MIIRYRQVLVWLAWAVFIIGSPIVVLAVTLKSQAESFASKLLNPVTVKDFEANVKRAVSFAKDADNFDNDNFPLGSIVAWHRDIMRETFPDDPATANLPLELGDAWIPCNGQSITRRDYERLFKLLPVNVKSIRLPDLNSDRRFLRGSQSSGIMEKGSGVVVDANRWVGKPWQQVINADGGPEEVPGSEYGGLFQHDDEKWGVLSVQRIKPVNMSVVWIIRVK